MAERANLHLHDILFRTDPSRTVIRPFEPGYPRGFEGARPPRKRRWTSWARACSIESTLPNCWRASIAPFSPPAPSSVTATSQTSSTAAAPLQRSRPAAHLRARRQLHRLCDKHGRLSASCDRVSRATDY